jgi:hypothetical protein
LNIFLQNGLERVPHKAENPRVYLIRKASKGFKRSYEKMSRHLRN